MSDESANSRHDFSEPSTNRHAKWPQVLIATFTAGFLVLFFLAVNHASHNAPPEFAPAQPAATQASQPGN